MNRNYPSILPEPPVNDHQITRQNFFNVWSADRSMPRPGPIVRYKPVKPGSSGGYSVHIIAFLSYDSFPAADSRDLLNIGQTLSAFWGAKYARDADVGSACLYQIFSFVDTHQFSQIIWNCLLDSGLITFLATELDGKWEPKFFGDCLSSFAAILNYAPGAAELQQIFHQIPYEILLERLFNLKQSIGPENADSYDHVLVHAVRMRRPGLGTVLNGVTAVCLSLAEIDPCLSEFRSNLLHKTLLDYLAAVYRGEEPDAISTFPPLRAYLSEFVDWVISLNFRALSPHALVCCFGSLELLTAKFPEMCERFYDLDLSELDTALREAGRDLYPDIREHFLNAIEQMAVYQPGKLCWKLEAWVTSFCCDEGSDFGITGLELLSLLFRQFSSEFFDLAFYDWLLGQLPDSRFERRVSLLRCFVNSLPETPDEQFTEQYVLIFEELSPLLDDWLSSDTEFSPFVLLQLQLLKWFVAHDFCDPEILRDFASFSALSSSLDEMTQTALHRTEAGFVAQTLTEVELYLRRFGLEVPRDPSDQTEAANQPEAPSCLTAETFSDDTLTGWDPESQPDCPQEHRCGEEEEQEDEETGHPVRDWNWSDPEFTLYTLQSDSDYSEEQFQGEKGEEEQAEVVELDMSLFEMFLASMTSL
jgi:hypothetical protein